MTWAALIVLALLAYGLKAVGFVALANLARNYRAAAIQRLLPAAMFTGLVITQSLGEAGGNLLLTRLAGLCAGAFAAWKRTPLIVVIVIAAGTTALFRLLLPG